VFEHPADGRFAAGMNDQQQRAERPDRPQARCSLEADALAAIRSTALSSWTTRSSAPAPLHRMESESLRRGRTHPFPTVIAVAEVPP
jgi:hypothetical protein